MKPLQSPFLWIGVTIAIVLIGIGIGAAIRFSRREPRGFRDYVKNPELWKELEMEHAEGENAIDQARTWDDKQIEAAVHRFVFGTASSLGARTEIAVLQSLSTKTHPVLMRLLRDTSTHSRLLATSETDRLPEAPFNRICNLLEKAPPPDAVPLLAPFLDEKSADIRKGAALVIASVGTDSIVPLVRKALGDSDEYVRSYALMGLERASKAKRLGDVCRQELFADVQRLISEGKNADHAALLFELNSGKATEFFLSGETLTPKSHSLHDVLEALNAKGVAIPRDRLLVLIEEIAATPPKYPQEYQLAAALHALGKHKNADDRAVLERYLSHSEETVVGGAAEGMIASHELEGFDDRIWQAANPSALKWPQRYYMAVMELDGEVCNGGFSQYFFNSSGDTWKAALKGLEEMGSQERLAILREALAKFDQASPAEIRDERMLQLAKVEGKSDDSVFRDLESRYYKSSEKLDAITMRYVLKNADAFGKR